MESIHYLESSHVTLLFLGYRVIGWWVVSYQLWKDVFSVDKELASKGKAWFLNVFLFIDLTLGLLQLYWFFFGMNPKIRRPCHSGYRVRKR